jgi:hypothetical protein
MYEKLTLMDANGGELRAAMLYAAALVQGSREAVIIEGSS